MKQNMIKHLALAKQDNTTNKTYQYFKKELMLWQSSKKTF